VGTEAPLTAGGPPPERADITGLVLAGGRGQRWGGRDKGLIEHAGRPLVAWVLEALAPQVGRLLVSANRNLDTYATFGPPVIMDYLDGFQGPLAGIAAALAVAETPWIVTAPCDGPALPEDLVARLTLALEHQGGTAAAARVGHRIQPVHALIPVARAPELTAYLAAGGRSVIGWLEGQPLALADFSDRPEAFANFNTPRDQGPAARQPPQGHEAPVAPRACKRPGPRRG
jgi:molybdopterin-guanine dinucleotide biosynthesis protein A